MQRKALLWITTILIFSLFFPPLSLAGKIEDSWWKRWKNLSTIVSPAFFEKVASYPVEITVRTTGAAKPETFKAWLNRNEITGKFIDNGTGTLTAFVGSEDGLLRTGTKGKWPRLNILKTEVRGYKNRKDVDIRLFWVKVEEYPDSDDDGVPDNRDGCPNDPSKTEPGVCGCGAADTDSDGDGTLDCNDNCPNDPGKIEPGVCGCGAADTDSDEDGTLDCNDTCPNDPDKIVPGVCGCGAADTDSDGDGTLDCNDNCSNDPGKIEPGVCGCGAADTDSDGDGIPNCIDDDYVELPPDPTDVAPALDRTVSTALMDATEFLYTGADPVQTGVVPGTIALQRAAVLRGKVSERTGDPLSGVTITIQNHPELGQTLTHENGLFDLAVNGGGYLTVQYAKDGYLDVQRRIDAPWQDYAWLPDVVMIPLDSQVTVIDTTSTEPFQIARGSLINDTRGRRRATLLFPQGVQAQAVLPGGGTQPLTTLSVRTTEYTVGENGPEAMPGELPTGIGYTYAVEFTVDEAAGATSVQFDQPLINYVENFIGFPTGDRVPAWYYDKQKAAWLPMADGRVIEILSIADDLAELDTTGDGAADNGADLGITDEERRRIAALYPTGQSLWRVPVSHFTPVDYNWPWEFPPGAEAPNPPPAELGYQPEADPCKESGSIIECQNQVLGQRIPVAGTPFALDYRSSRVTGNRRSYTAQIPLTAETLPAAGLVDIRLKISVAGRHVARTFSSVTPDMTYTFEWDGLDAYGRTLQGAQPITVRIGYTYNAQYQCGGSSCPAAQPVTVWNQWKGSVGPWDALSLGLGGWTLSGHHAYDPVGKVLHLGNGDQQGGQAFTTPVVTTVAGVFEEDGYGGDGGPATAALLDGPQGIEIGPDGSVYFSDFYNYVIRRISPDGIISTIAGRSDESWCYGIGGPAASADLGLAEDLAVAPDGGLYIMSHVCGVLRMDPEGILHTVVPHRLNAQSCYGDGLPAANAWATLGYGIDVGPDGSVYFTQNWSSTSVRCYKVRRVGPYGIVTRVAGNGFPGYWGDGGPAVQAALNDPWDAAVGPDGSLYIADSLNSAIRKVAPDGIITTIAGGEYGFEGDGGPAVDAKLGYPGSIVAAPDGSLYFTDVGPSDTGRVRRIGPSGIITTVAGNGEEEGEGEAGASATATSIGCPSGIALAPDGSLYITDSCGSRILRVAPSDTQPPDADLQIPSSDGREVYVLDASGRHLKTLNGLTGAVLYLFTYDSNNLLSTITDDYNNTVTIARDPRGTPLAIIGPYGQRTELSLDANGYLDGITNPAGETQSFVYTESGLLTEHTDPRGNTWEYTYDASGRLERADDPAGGRKTLARTELSEGYEATVTTALRRVSAYRVETLATGESRYTNSAGCCGTSQSVSGTDGTNTTTYADGTVKTMTLGPDPRFGMQAPILSALTLQTPDGLEVSASATRTVSLSDPDDLLSLTGQTDIVTVNGNTYTRDYVALARQLTFTTPAGRQKVVTLDSNGRVVRTQTTGMAPAVYIYDTAGRLTDVTVGEGVEARDYTIGYTAGGWLTDITDPLGRTTGFEHDAAGRTTARILPDGRRVELGYDTNGNITSVTPPGRPAHTKGYTAINLPAVNTPPDIGITTATTYGYNLDGQLTQVNRPDGTTVSLDYDTVSGRLSSISFPEGSIGYTYDAASGKPVAVSAPGGQNLSLAYDGLLLTEVGWSGPVPGTVAAVHDDNLRVTALSVNGAAIGYTYDNDGLLTSAGSLAITRDSATGLATATALGSVTDAMAFNSFAEPMGYAAAFNSSAVYDVSYTRENGGRITTMAETIGGVTTAYDYDYDEAGRLTTVTTNGSVTDTYAYDANGNRISYSDGAATTTGTYDAQDRLLQYGDAGFSYSAAGELTAKSDSGQNTAYSYDALGNLRRVTLPDSTVIEYVIDGFNRRVGKRVNGALVQGLLYKDLLRPVAELDGSGAVVARFVYANGANVPAYMVRGGNTYRIITDHRGSVRLVVDTASGTVAQRMDYDAFGYVLADTNPGFQPFGFAGGLYDADTGLTRFGRRDYDADTGRWTAKDPIGFRGRSANLYGYVLNDPINYTDVIGLAASASFGGPGNATDPSLGSVIAGEITDVIVGAANQAGLVDVDTVMGSGAGWWIGETLVEDIQAYLDLIESNKNLEKSIEEAIQLQQQMQNDIDAITVDLEEIEQWIEDFSSLLNPCN